MAEILSYGHKLFQGCRYFFIESEKPNARETFKIVENLGRPFPERER